MSTPNPIYQVDAFTAEPFKGNPAGVCILENEMPEEWMQNVAMEMNLSETAFIVPDKNFDICFRCFAPALGIDEDPVTGSAHCSLAPFWHGRTGNNFHIPGDHLPFGRRSFAHFLVNVSYGVAALTLMGFIIGV